MLKTGLLSLAVGISFTKIYLHVLDLNISQQWCLEFNQKCFCNFSSFHNFLMHVPEYKFCVLYL